MIRNCRFSVLALLLLIGACATPPSPPAHRIAMPAQYATEGGQSVPLVLQWWQGFGAGELAGFITTALESNPDVAIAVRRVEQAEAQARIAGATLFPVVNLNASTSRNESRAFGAARFSNTDASGLSFSASYEIDFWEKNASTARAAQLSLEASRFDADTARLTLVTGVANAYFQLLSTRDRLRVARENVAIAERVLSVVNARFKFGSASALDVNRQLTTVATQRAAVPPLALQERQSLAALAVLLGRPVGELNVTADSVVALQVPRPSPGMPSDLLVRRPDLASAEAQLAAANASIAAARGALLPTISLTGSTGLSTAALLSLAHPARSLTVGSTLLQPIFNAGRLRAQVDLASAREGELVEVYRRAILSALADVENSLAAGARTAEQEVLQLEVRDRARRALELAEMRYRAGTDDLLTVLDAQRTLFSAQVDAAQVRLSRLQASVALYKAVGGGWTAPMSDASSVPK